MKAVPYKCRFGHITIIKFKYGPETLGTIECETCKELAGSKIFEKRANNKIYEVGFVKRGEKAVRF